MPSNGFDLDLLLGRWSGVDDSSAGRFLDLDDEADPELEPIVDVTWEVDFFPPYRNGL